jgi:hypothetical protein
MGLGSGGLSPGSPADMARSQLGGSDQAAPEGAYSAGHPVLHPNDISQTDKQQRPDSGVIDHVAFGSRGFEAMKQHLTGKGVFYRVNQVPNSTRWQIFLRDPNNVEIELNFEPRMRPSTKVSDPGFAGSRRLPRLCFRRSPQPRAPLSASDSSPSKNCHRKFRLLTSTVSRCRSGM